MLFFRGAWFAFLAAVCVAADSRVYVGSTPAGPEIRRILRMDAEAELVQWKLTLGQDRRYTLRCEYGMTVAGKPGVGRGKRTLDRSGAWLREDGVVALYGVASLLEVDENVLHLLNADGSLMVGNGGWSYSLNRAELVEPGVDPELTNSMPEVSYRLTPKAAGADVFGVFEGRSPCQRIASQLGMKVHGGCMKVKWRLTLYQHAETKAPARYKVEGSLFREAPGEGTWSAHGKVLRLSPSKGGREWMMLRGDNNVLFLLDPTKKPLIGNEEFSYTLNRTGVPLLK